MDNVVDIEAGSNHSLALKADGTVWSWGNNQQGQLGDSTTATDSVPLKVHRINNVVDIAAGQNHSLALEEDGTVWAWGRNLDGQLGDSTTANDSVPVKVKGFTNSKVLHLEAGYSHSLAITADTTIWSWGNNIDGQLGIGDTNNSLVPVTVDSACTVKLPCHKIITLDTTVCGSYVTPSQSDTLYTSGQYEDDIYHANACDTFYTINLTINSSSSDTVNPTVCKRYITPSGQDTFRTSGTYFDTVSNHLGCDSTIRINLTVDSPLNISGTIYQPTGDTIIDTTIVQAYRLIKSTNKVKQVSKDTLTSSAIYTSQVPCQGTYFLRADPLATIYSDLLTTYYPQAINWDQASNIYTLNDTNGIDIRLQKIKQSDTSQGNGRIRGRIIEGVGYENNKITQGDPLANINCSIVETGRDSIYQTTKTNNKGVFEFVGLPSGNYHITADAPGKPIDTTGLNNFTIEEDGTRYDSVVVEVDSEKVSVTNKEIDSSAPGTYISPLTEDLMVVRRIYPNPVRNQLHIKLMSNSTRQPLIVTLRNIEGEEVYYRLQRSIKPGQQKITIPLSRVPAGPVLLELKSKHSSFKYRRKIIKVE